ncbi:MAG: hypothetical protein LBS92_02200 [Candidatus Methanoplasma sp.]|nr:hypothetical protein [Candidatus Methanoplasma sp.]
MKKTVFALAAVAFVIVVLVLSTLPVTTESESLDSYVVSFGGNNFSDREVSVVGLEVSAISSRLSSSTGKISASSDLSSISGGDVLIVGASWARAQATDLNDSLSTLYESGTPVIVLEDCAQTASSTGARAVGQYKSPATGGQRSYSYTVETLSLDETLKRAYNWADYVLNENSLVGAVVGESFATATSYSYGDKEAGAFAWYYVRTMYREIPSDDASESYWSAEYNLQSIPKASNYRTTGLNIKSEVGNGVSESNLLDYGPTTVYGTDVVSETIDTYLIKRTVSYSIPGVQVLDYSNYGQDKAEWFHQIDAGSNAAKTPYQVKPGAIIADWKDSDGSYHSGDDLYRGEYRQTTLTGYSGVSSYELYVPVNIGGFAPYY